MTRTLSILIFGLMLVFTARLGLADDKSDFRKLEDHVKKYLKDSRAARAHDKKDLRVLITAICKKDIESSGDAASRLAKSMTDKAKAGARNKFKKLTRRNTKLTNRTKRFLKSGNPFRKPAGKFMGMLRSDLKALTNVKQGVYNGANNPVIRSKLLYGQQMHRRMQGQSKFHCDKKEVRAGGGRADCVSFKHCKVWEFKPSGYSRSTAMGQARGYIRDVNNKFKKDKAAAKCFSSGKKGFAPDVAFYKACK